MNNIEYRVTTVTAQGRYLKQTQSITLSSNTRRVLVFCHELFSTHDRRTKDLIEVVIQLNAKEGFMALSTFHTDTLEVYPIIFVDPSKVTNHLYLSIAKA